jgi:hypothetical protein
VLRNIGMSVGSAIGAAVLLGYTRHGDTYPEIGGFRAALFVAAGFSVLTAILSWVLPGRTVGRIAELDEASRREVDRMMEEEAELAGAGAMFVEEHDPTERDGDAR